jgi:hypothetical protein
MSAPTQTRTNPTAARSGKVRCRIVLDADF